MMHIKWLKQTSQEIDIAEIHDAFSVCELMAVEDLSLSKKKYWCIIC